MKPLETKRLILRSFRLDDLEDFFRYAKVPGVGEMAGWKHHETLEESRRILNHFIEQDEVYAIELKETRQVIGSLGVHLRPNPMFSINEVSREIGFVLSKDYWGQGYIPEAVKTVVEHGFKERNIDVFWAGHFLSNRQSKRVIEKCGFTYYGRSSFYISYLNQYVDEEIYYLKKP